jgi:hypothetical protein
VTILLPQEPVITGPPTSEQQANTTVFAFTIAVPQHVNLNFLETYGEFFAERHAVLTPENAEEQFNDYLRTRNTNPTQSTHPRIHFIHHNMSNPSNLNDFLHRTFMQHQPQGPPPTSKSAIEKLPCFELTKERQHFLNHSFDELSCGVCLEDLQVGEKILQVPCHHCFHADCLKPWITEHNTCPTCRFELPVDDKEQEQERIKRMQARFSKESLEIMEIGNATDSVFDRVSRLKNLNESKENVIELNSCELVLTQSLESLDRMSQFKDDKVRAERKSQVKKILSLLSMVDDVRKDYENKERVDMMQIDHAENM